jgi:hypothetical protein
MKFGTHICQIILFLKTSLAIAIAAIFKMADAKTKWRHFHIAWLHVLSIYYYIYHCLAFCGIFLYN